MEETKDHRKVIVTFLAVVIIAVIVVAAVAASPKKKQASASSNTAMKSTADSGTSTPSTPPSTATSGSGGSSSSSSFKDGSYTATGSYESPGGNESITVHVTLKDGVVATTSADSGAQDPDAQSYQDAFISNYKSLVVGKNISGLSLSRVSGSSLTSQGFNDAIQQIENQAKA